MARLIHGSTLPLHKLLDAVLLTMRTVFVPGELVEVSGGGRVRTARYEAPSPASGARALPNPSRLAPNNVSTASLLLLLLLPTADCCC